MNMPPPRPNPQFQTEEFKQYLLNKQGKGPLFAFLLTSSFVFLAFLISVLKPHRLYKNLIGYLFSISITINNNKWKLKHLLILICGFYATLYFFLLMQGRQYYPIPNEPYKVKMAKLDRKWVVESQSWLAFLIIVCILSIYKNSELFSLEKKLIETTKELDKNKTKKNE